MAVTGDQTSRGGGTGRAGGVGTPGVDGGFGGGRSDVRSGSPRGEGGGGNQAGFFIPGQAGAPTAAAVPFTQSPEFQAIFDAIRARRAAATSAIAPAPSAPAMAPLNIQPVPGVGAAAAPATAPAQINPQIASFLQALISSQGQQQSAPGFDFGQLILGG